MSAEQGVVSPSNPQKELHRLRTIVKETDNHDHLGANLN
jgi:hypothetical protein